MALGATVTVLGSSDSVAREQGCVPNNSYPVPRAEVGDRGACLIDGID